MYVVMIRCVIKITCGDEKSFTTLRESRSHQSLTCPTITIMDIRLELPSSELFYYDDSVFPFFSGMSIVSLGKRLARHLEASVMER